MTICPGQPAVGFLTAVNTVGNLALTNGKLNAKMQNASWPIKKPALQAKSTLLITTASILVAGEWNESTIDQRSAYLIAQAVETWPRPQSTVPDESRWDDSAGPQDNEDVDDDE